MTKNNDAVDDFVLRSIYATSSWMCRQIDADISVDFSRFWENWHLQTNEQSDRSSKHLDRGRVPEIIGKCINILADRYHQLPIIGQIRDDIPSWDKEKLCRLLAEIGVDSQKIETLCQKLDRETLELWQARSILAQQPVPSQIDDPYLRGIAPSFVHARELLFKVSPTNLPVLLCGETGTGKEVFAHAIHRHSDRANGPLLALNCGAIPEATLETELFGYGPGAFTGALNKGYEGKLASAHLGTLFLDEVAELPIRIQIALLRFLETGEIQPLGDAKPKKFDVRLVFASQSDPDELLTTGRMRPEFYYRVTVFPIVLPPLRDRLKDLPIIVSNIMNDIAKARGLRTNKLLSQALDVLEKHPWHGNIRELKNILERASLLSAASMIDADHLEKILETPLKHQIDTSVEKSLLSKLKAVSKEHQPPVSLTSLAGFIESHRKQGIRNEDYRSLFHVSETTARRHLIMLVNAGVLRREGSKKGAKYYCT